MNLNENDATELDRFRVFLRETGAWRKENPRPPKCDKPATSEWLVRYNKAIDAIHGRIYPKP